MTEDLLPQPDPQSAGSGAGFLADKLARHAEPSPADAWQQLEHNLDARPHRWRPLGFWMLAALLVALPLSLWQWQRKALDGKPAEAYATGPEAGQVAHTARGSQGANAASGQLPADDASARGAEGGQAGGGQTNATAVAGPNEAMPKTTQALDHGYLARGSEPTRQVAEGGIASDAASLGSQTQAPGQGAVPQAGSLGHTGAASGTGMGLSGVGGVQGMVALRSVRTERRATQRHPGNEAHPSPQGKTGQASAARYAADPADAEAHSTTAKAQTQSGSAGTGNTAGNGAGSSGSATTNAEAGGRPTDTNQGSATTAEVAGVGTDMPKTGQGTGMPGQAADSATQVAQRQAPKADSLPKTVTPTTPKAKSRIWQIGVVAGGGGWQQQAQLPATALQPDAVSYTHVANLQTGPVFNIGAFVRRPIGARLGLELRLAVRYASQTLTMHHMPGPGAPITYTQVGRTVLAMPPATVEHTLHRRLVLPAAFVQVSYGLTPKLSATAGAGLQANLATGQIAEAAGLPWLSPMLSAGLRRQLTPKLAVGLQGSFFGWRQSALPTLSNSSSTNQLGLINLEYGF